MEYSVYISTCGILLLSRSLPESLRQSVQDSLLFSQLSADEDFRESPGVVAWRDVFDDSLMACGWHWYDTEEWSFPADGDRFRLSHNLLRILGAHVSSAQKSSLEIASKALSALPGDSPIAKVFHDHVVMKRQAHTKMQLGIVDQEGVLKIATILFQTAEDVGPNPVDHLFNPAKVQGPVKTAFVEARLNVKIYEDCAEDIVQWLGPQRQTHSVRIDQP